MKLSVFLMPIASIATATHVVQLLAYAGYVTSSGPLCDTSAGLYEGVALVNLVLAGGVKFIPFL